MPQLLVARTLSFSDVSFVFIMAEQGSSAPTELVASENPTACETQAPQEPLSLNNLSPAQAQRVLEAALQHYRAEDESRVVDAGTSAAVPSLTNAGLTTPSIASGEVLRGRRSLLNMLTSSDRVIILAG